MKETPPVITATPILLLTKEEKLAHLQDTIVASMRHPGTLFVPSATFYKPLKSDKDLTRMATTLFGWLGIKHHGLRVLFSDIDEQPSRFVDNDEGMSLIVHAKYQQNSYVCAAVLAHVLMKFVLTKRHRIALEGAGENELLLDLALVHAGLGVLYLNGHQYHLGCYDSLKPREHLSLGVLSPKELAEEIDSWASSRRIPRSSYVRLVAPWVRKYFSGKRVLQPSPPDIVSLQQQVKRLNFRFFSIAALTSILAMLVVIFILMLPKKESAELVAQRAKIQQLTDDYKTCADKVEQKRRTYDTNDLYILRNIEADIRQCDTIRKQLSSEVDSYNKKLK